MSAATVPSTVTLEGLAPAADTLRHHTSSFADNRSSAISISLPSRAQHRAHSWHSSTPKRWRVNSGHGGPLARTPHSRESVLSSADEGPSMLFTKEDERGEDFE